MSFRKRAAMSRAFRFGTRNRRPMWEPSRRPPPSAFGFTRRPLGGGATRALRLVVLGDGAPWIWGIAAEHFHQAIQIVDLYHARERLSDLSKTVLGLDSPQTQQWGRLNQELLDRGDVEAVLASMRQLPARDDIARKARETSIRYFQKNAERMRYACFRSQGLFIGSGVIEAGCKTIIGQRLKQSGMRWTVRGANAIIALRCCQLSNRWEEFWEARSAG